MEVKGLFIGALDSQNCDDYILKESKQQGDIEMKWIVLGLVLIAACGVGWRHVYIDEYGERMYYIECGTELECLERVSNTCSHGYNIRGMANGYLVVQCK